MAEPQPKAGGPAAPQDLNTEGLRPHAAAEGELVSRSQRRRNKKASGQVPGDDHLEKWAAKYGNGVSHAEASSRESTNPSCSGQGEGEATAAPVLGGKGCPHRRAAVKHLARHNAVCEALLPELMERVGEVDAAATAAVLSRLNLVSGGGHGSVTGGVIEADAYGCDGARAGYVRRRIAQRSSQLATALLHPAARECLDLLFSLGAACIPGQNGEKGHARVLDIGWRRPDKGDQRSRGEHLLAAVEGGGDAAQGGRGGEEGGGDGVVAPGGGGAGGVCRVLSVGGGSGSDALGLVLMRDLAGCGGPAFHVLIADYEPGWRHCALAVLPALRAASKGRHPCEGDSVDCVVGDVTLPAAHPTNAAVSSRVGEMEMFVFSYVLAENLQALEAGGLGLVQDILLCARLSAMVLILDSTHRLLPSIAARAASLGWTPIKPRWEVDVTGGSKNVLLLRRDRLAAHAGEPDGGERAAAEGEMPEWTRRPQRGLGRAKANREKYRSSKRAEEACAHPGVAAAECGAGVAEGAPSNLSPRNLSPGGGESRVEGSGGSQAGGGCASERNAEGVDTT